jgi:hypothetical protein
VSQATPPPAAPDSLDQLLKLGADAARSGNRPAARSLFLALSREHPHDVRVWIGLAGVAASRNEQREALERIVALDPDHERARQALARLNGDAPAPPSPRVTPLLVELPRPLPAEDEELGTAVVVEPRSPTLDDDTQPAPAPFPVLNVIAMAVILLLLAALGVLLGRALLDGARPQPAPTATPGLILQPTPGGAAGPSGSTSTQPPGVTAAPATATPAETATSPARATAATVESTAPAAAATSRAQPTAATAPARATAVPTPAQNLTLPMGTPLDYDGWTAVLVRPDYAVPLDGAIGELRPTGRFVLAVVAVSNNSPTPRVIPPDMFALVDAAGRSFAPVPGASTAYLALYERAQRGDLALEDTFEPVVGLRSVPVIFDVPLDAAGLRLTVKGAGPAGWPVGETGPTPVPSGP